MINVELMVPALSRDTLELSIDESMTVAQAIVDMQALVRLDLLLEADDDAGDYLLCDIDAGRILLPERSLTDCKVTSGTRLMLV